MYNLTNEIWTFKMTLNEFCFFNVQLILLYCNVFAEAGKWPDC